MTCRHCGAQIQSLARYCPACGRRLPRPRRDPPLKRDFAWASVVLALVGPSFLLVLLGFFLLAVVSGTAGEAVFVTLATSFLALLLMPTIGILGLGAAVTGLIAWRGARTAPTEYGGHRLAQFGTLLGMAQLAGATAVGVWVLLPLFRS